MENEEVFLTLATIFTYLKATPESRSFVEGEQVLNSNHVFLCGIISCTEKEVQLFCLCLTSALKERPHEIKGKLSISDNRVEIQEFNCTCKAGLSGTCKHVAAVLLKCTRANILSFEKLSTTDVECYWAKSKKYVEEQYEAKSLLETECLKGANKQTCRTPTASENEECLQTLMSACPSSSLVKHLKGRVPSEVVPDFEDSPSKTFEVPVQISSILSTAAGSNFLPTLNLSVGNYNLKSCCKKIFNAIKNIDVTHVAVTAQPLTEEWKRERQYRLTGSRCYTVYTFSKENWENKAKSYFKRQTFTNPAVRHGMAYEKPALHAYKTKNNYEVYEPGLIICKQYPWLAYSADGIVFQGGKPTRLVEIKCPVIGLEQPAINFVHSCKYLTLETERLCLKQKHIYYGQVQLGMAILNLEITDLIVYSPYSNSFLNITVPFDEQFARSMLSKITSNYFTHMLHFLCEKENCE